MRDPDPELAHPEAAGWVLGTLDPDDAVWFAGHLPSCPDCRAAVAEFGPGLYSASASPAALIKAFLERVNHPLAAALLGKLESIQRASIDR